LIDF
jgi:hypothetical protein